MQEESLEVSRAAIAVAAAVDNAAAMVDPGPVPTDLWLALARAASKLALAALEAAERGSR